MNSEAFKLARDTLRLAVKEYGWSRAGRYATCYTSGPGRFGGEHWSIVYWYDSSMNGANGEAFYNGDSLECEAFEVDDTERAAFGLKADTSHVALFYSESGSVSMEKWTQKHFDKVTAERENESETEE